MGGVTPAMPLFLAQVRDEADLTVIRASYKTPSDSMSEGA